MLKKSSFSKTFKRAQTTFPKKLILLSKMKNACRENANSEAILKKIEKHNKKNHWLEARQDWK